MDISSSMFSSTSSILQEISPVIKENSSINRIIYLIQTHLLDKLSFINLDESTRILKIDSSKEGEYIFVSRRGYNTINNSKQITDELKKGWLEQVRRKIDNSDGIWWEKKLDKVTKEYIDKIEKTDFPVSLPLDDILRAYEHKKTEFIEKWQNLIGISKITIISSTKASFYSTMGTKARKKIDNTINQKVYEALLKRQQGSKNEKGAHSNSQIQWNELMENVYGKGSKEYKQKVVFLKNTQLLDSINYNEPPQTKNGKLKEANRKNRFHGIVYLATLEEWKENYKSLAKDIKEHWSEDQRWIISSIEYLQGSEKLNKTTKQNLELLVNLLKKDSI